MPIAQDPDNPSPDPGQSDIGTLPSPHDPLAPVDRTAAGNTCLEVGDTLELVFDVCAATDGLPQVYSGLGSGTAAEGSGTTGKEPSYFPRIGEYWSSWTYEGVNPLSNSFGYTDVTSGVYRVDNANLIMDMDYLHHDAGFTADKPGTVDVWEMFDGSYTYIPGTSNNSDDGSYS